MQAAGEVAPHGDLGLKLIRQAQLVPPAVIEWPSNTEPRAILEHGMPRRGLTDEVNLWRARNFLNLWRGIRRVKLAKLLNLPTQYGALYLTKITGDGEIVPYGLASLRVVTTVGVNFIVDAFQNITEVETMCFHGYGTGGAAEAVGNTALTTELTTEYVVNSTRPTGTTTEGASANIYRTVATLSPDSGGTIAITEHGVFSASSAGVLLDRSLFSAVNVVASADSLQTTYELTFPAGS